MEFWFKSRNEKIYFYSGRHGGYLGFPIRTVLPIFDLCVTPMFPTKIKSTGFFWIRSRNEKYIFKVLATVDILDFRSERF